MTKQIIKCGMEQLDALDTLYDRVTEYLENTINYPIWTRGEYPCRESIKNAVLRGEQYICIDEDGAAVGAFVLNEDPAGDYGSGGWSVQLEEGEYLIIHTLAVLPESAGRGIGGYMVRYCIDKARNEGYKAVRLDVVPGNIPARRLYEKEGFMFAGKKDLRRGIAAIPEFELYELNFDNAGE